MISRCEQQVTVHGEVFEFERGESIHTESSYKYSIAEFESIAGRAGFQPVDVWCDAKGLFSVQFFRHGLRKVSN